MNLALAIASAAPRSDRLGVAISTICILHCLAMPVIAVLLPIAAALEGTTHAALAAGIVLVGAVAFVPGYRSHRKAAVLALAVAGASAIVSPLVFEALEAEGVEQALIAGGGAALIAAHLANVYFCRVCPGRAHEKGCVPRLSGRSG
ncbi:MAG: MerC domain-containing protein [Burkholderiales bacterium]